MLHTDFFNKNNKRKMSKPDYLKNLGGQGICDDVLDCFYDNIIYTPFIHLEDDEDILTMRTKKADRKTAKAARAAKAAIKNGPTDPTKKLSKEPLDPYTLIFESRLDTLRPPLKTIMVLDDPYTYLGSLPFFDNRVLRNSKIGVIQIESARSRPDAWMSASGIANPEPEKVGLVDLPIDKVGVLWRKDPKKKTARSPWQEWGAILTGANLYFFKNSSWVKSYLHQYESWVKHGGGGTPCMFKPPLSSFEPDYRLPIDHGVALQDANYKRHKNGFTFFGHNNSEQVFLADNEWDLNDWLARLNHQAACKTAGIRQRGPVGGHYDGQRQRGMRRPDGSSSSSTTRVQTPTGEVIIQSGKIDPTLAQQISTARREAVEAKIQDADEKIATTTQELDEILRDARHLLILAPIQSKTREQIVCAAERINEKLKLKRVELWRFKCHRDILQMDLDEERIDFEKRQARIDKVPGNPPSRGTTNGVRESDEATDSSNIERMASSRTDSSTASKPRPLSPSQRKHQPHKSEDSTVLSSISTVDEDEYHTPLGSTPTDLTPAQSPLLPKPLPSASSLDAAASPLKVASGLHGHTLSINSNYSHTSRLQPPAPRSSMEEPLPSPVTSDYQDIATDDDNEQVRSEAGDVVGEIAGSIKSDGSRPVTPSSAILSKTKSDAAPVQTTPTSTPDRKSRRHSLQPSLRDGKESRGHAKHGSRKSNRLSSAKDSPAKDESNASPKSNSASNDEVNGTGLRREKPSFTIHGKKASIVNFGGEWATNAEETLNRIKAATSPPHSLNHSDSTTSPPSASALLKSPLSRSVSNAVTDSDADGEARDDASTIRELSTDASTTPTPGSPGGDALRQPSKSEGRRMSNRSARPSGRSFSEGAKATSSKAALEGSVEA
jgi:hypothetical protein